MNSLCMNAYSLLTRFINLFGNRVALILFFILLFSSLLLLPSYAQNHTAIQYTPEDGLCGQSFSMIFRDNRGRIWVSSAGPYLNMFDSQEWHCFFSSDILKGRGGVFFEDRWKDIWVLHDDEITCNFVCIKNNKILTFSIPGMNSNHLMLFTMRANIPHIIDITAKKVYRYDPGVSRFLLINSGKKVIPEEIKNITWMRTGIKGNTLVINTESKVYTAFLNEKNEIQIEFTFPEKSRIQAINDRQCLEFKENGKIIYHSHTDNRILDLSQVYVRNFSGEVSRLPISTTNYRASSIVDSSLILLRSSPTSGQYIIQEYRLNTMQLVNQLHYSSTEQPFSITKDKGGDYWVSSEGKIQRILNEQYFIASKSNFNQFWSVGVAHNGMVWLGSSVQGLKGFNGFNYIEAPVGIPKIKYGQYFDGSIKTRANTLLFNYASYLNQHFTVAIKEDGTAHTTAVSAPGLFWNYDRSGRLMRGTLGDGLYVYKSEHDLRDEGVAFKIDASRGLQLQNVLSALQDKYGRYWMTRPSMGIALYDSLQRRVINWLIQDNPENIGGMTMEQDMRGNLWIADNLGLYYFKMIRDIRPGFSLAKHLRPISKEILGNRAISAMKMIDSSTLYLGTDIGYYLLDLNQYYKYDGAIRYKGIFTTSNKNYPGGRIHQNGCSLDKNGNIWMITSNGVVCHLSNKYKLDISPQEAFIDSVLIGNRVIAGNALLVPFFLKSNENTLTIYFSHGIDPDLGQNILYRYKLNDNAWSKPVDERFIHIQNLEAGNYTFKLRTDKNGYLSEIKTISFYNRPPLANDWRFWAAIFIPFLGLGLYLYSRQRILFRQRILLNDNELALNRLNRRNDILKLHAITNQLNPHFVNNTLNWLQLRVGNDPVAIEALDKLSKNFRTVLRNSRDGIVHHSLCEELRFTENYLFLQKCRFGERLKYILPTNEEVDKLDDVYVPIMSIQIHTENAIEHGIRNNRDGAGWVKIRVEHKPDRVVVRIEDTGVGRAKSREIKSLGTQYGTQMLRDIEQIYNKFNILPISHRYEDDIFMNEQCIRFGTRVIITFPKKFDFKLL